MSNVRQAVLYSLEGDLVLGPSGHTLTIAVPVRAGATPATIVLLGEIPQVIILGRRAYVRSTGHETGDGEVAYKEAWTFHAMEAGQ